MSNVLCGFLPYSFGTGSLARPGDPYFPARFIARSPHLTLFPLLSMLGFWVHIAGDLNPGPQA